MCKHERVNYNSRPHSLVLKTAAKISVITLRSLHCIFRNVARCEAILEMFTGIQKH